LLIPREGIEVAEERGREGGKVKEEISYSISIDLALSIVQSSRFLPWPPLLLGNLGTVDLYLSRRRDLPSFLGPQGRRVVDRNVNFGVRMEEEEGGLLLSISLLPVYDWFHHTCSSRVVLNFQACQQRETLFLTLWT
jgi:hypothetical protein